MASANELSALISKAVEEQTFSLDGVKAISAIRDRAVTLEASLADTTKRLSEKDVSLDDLRRQIACWNAKQIALEAREAAVTTREAAMLNLEKGTAVAQAQFSVLDSVFKTIFANRIVREKTVQNTPVPMNTGSATYVSNFESSNTVDRTEG